MGCSPHVCSELTEIRTPLFAPKVSVDNDETSLPLSGCNETPLPRRHFPDAEKINPFKNWAMQGNKLTEIRLHHDSTLATARTIISGSLLEQHQPHHLQIELSVCFLCSGHLWPMFFVRTWKTSLGPSTLHLSRSGCWYPLQVELKDIFSGGPGPPCHFHSPPSCL